MSYLGRTVIYLDECGGRSLATVEGEEDVGGTAPWLDLRCADGVLRPHVTILEPAGEPFHHWTPL